jgi:hypothetical protein
MYLDEATFYLEAELAPGALASATLERAGLGRDGLGRDGALRRPWGYFRPHDADGARFEQPDVSHVVGQEGDVPLRRAAHHHLGLAGVKLPVRGHQFDMGRGHACSGLLLQLAGFGHGALCPTDVEERLLRKVVQLTVDQGFERLDRLGNWDVEALLPGEGFCNKERL